ncbi:MAG: translation elongation factor-like protein [Candidatus Omnitrophica bacterium]|nr:translation elongation factor-like protein [Candidatus Omnitrophota bacterium]
MAEPQMEAMGKISAFFAHPSAAIVDLTAPLRLGERIYVKGHTTEFQQVVDSMQLDHQPMQEAAVGQSIAVKMQERCRKGDVVYKLAV